MALTAAVVVYILCCLITGYFGRYRRMGFFGTFMISLVITPLLMLILLALFGPSPAVEWRVPRKDK
jgi:uncharacterized membrane protein